MSKVGASKDAAAVSMQPQGTVHIPIMNVRFPDGEKDRIRHAALGCARAMGLSDDEWNRHRAPKPFMHDLEMIADPARKVERMRSGNDQ